MEQKTDWNGKRVVILGGARQGQAAARWLARHGAMVTVNDRRSAEEMTQLWAFVKTHMAKSTKARNEVVA